MCKIYGALKKEPPVLEGTGGWIMDLDKLNLTPKLLTNS